MCRGQASSCRQTGRMLDRLCISPHRVVVPGSPIDLGALGEAMLFYGEVRLFADSTAMAQLIRDLDPNDLFAALGEGYLKITYSDGGYAILSESGGPIELHRPTTFHLDRMNFDEVVDNAFNEKLGNSSKSRNMRRKLSPFVELQKWDDSAENGIRADFQSRDYLTRAVRLIATAADPQGISLDQCTFDLQPEGEFFAVETDIDFEAINRGFHKRVSPEVASITPAFILSELFNSRVALERGAAYQGEIATDALTTQLQKLRCEDLIERNIAGTEQLNLFQDRVLTGRSVREAINRGDRSFAELLKVIAAARQFRSWIAGQPDDNDLLGAYYRDISKKSWIGQLPTKFVRWAVFGTAGLSLAALGVPTDVASGAALGLGAFDALLLDRIGGGWRPSQFVDGKLTRFVDE
jgi:hypothetical protein